MPRQRLRLRNPTSAPPMSDDLLAPCLTGKYKNKKPQLGRLDKPHNAGQICEGFIFLATAAAQSSSRTDADGGRISRLRSSGGIWLYRRMWRRKCAVKKRFWTTNSDRRWSALPRSPKRSLSFHPSPFGYVYCRQTLGGQSVPAPVHRTATSLPPFFPPAHRRGIVRRSDQSAEYA